MAKPRYTPAASADLVEILEYVARDKPSAAIKLIERIEAKCLLIASQPAIGEFRPEFGRDVQLSTVGRYVIYYRVQRGAVEILRVIPGDMDVTEL